MEAALLNTISYDETDPDTLRTCGTELLRAEEAPLRRVIRRYVHDDASVDDLFQEISIKVLRRLHTVRNPATVRGWLFQLARNACLDHLRAADRRPAGHPLALELTRAEGELGRDPSDRLLSSERIASIHQAMNELPESQRVVLRLRVQEQLDHMQIADRLGISRQAVEVRLCRGRANLKERLDAILDGDL